MWKDIWSPMFVAVLFTVAKKWKQQKDLLTDEWKTKCEIAICEILTIRVLRINKYANKWTYSVSSVQSLSHIWLFATPWAAAYQASLSITNSRSFLKLMSTESLMPSNYLILCCPLLPPSIFPSIRVFSNDSVLRIRWPKYWSFNLDISPSSEYSGLISFRMDWLDLLAVQGALKSLIQHHSSKASILWGSAFFIIQLSHPYMITGKNHSFD